MPEIPPRRNPGYEGMDSPPEAGSPGAYAWAGVEFRMTSAERAAWRKCLREKEARRIPLGFAIPPREE